MFESVQHPVTPHLSGSTALSYGLWRCKSCAAVCEAADGELALTCPRCAATITQRKPDSVSRCWAFLAAAGALYIPANLLAVTQTSSIFASQTDTILSGIVYLWLEGSWPLAVLVFVASIVVPLFKLLGLSYLLVSVHRRSRRNARRRTVLYRALELIGRWSMLDVYVITWLAALVHIQTLANITPGPGAIAFGAVVVLTMLATQSFDPRLIWDAIDAPRQHAVPQGHHLEIAGQP